MTDVAIVGAGELGGSIASILAHRDLVRSITLIDATGQVAAGKALDIMQVAPIARFSTRVTGSTDLSRAAGASVVLVADHARDGEFTDETGLSLLKQLSQMAAGRVVICAGAGHQPLVDRGVRELRYPWRQLLGSAPEALAGAVRALVALDTNGSAADVALTVLGLPPAHAVVPWEEATIAGMAATAVLDEPTRRRLAARVAPLWPPGPYALATAAATVVSAMAGRSRRRLSCFVAPEADARARHRTVALPVALSPMGIQTVELPRLSGNSRVALENALLL